MSVCLSVCLSELNQQICISPAPGRSSKLTRTGVEIDTCAFQTGCQLSSAATGMSLELRFMARFQWREAYTCWTTGSWRSCLSLEVVSSIPAGSTIIYRFLCGFICVSLCQSIKIKPTNMYAYMYVCMYVCMYVGTQLVSFRFEYRLPVPEHRN